MGCSEKQFYLGGAVPVTNFFAGGSRLGFWMKKRFLGALPADKLLVSSSTHEIEREQSTVKLLLMSSAINVKKTNDINSPTCFGNDFI